MSGHAETTLNHERRIGNLEAQERPIFSERMRWRGSGTSTPADATDGDVWNDTTAGGNTIKIYANSGWRALN